MKIILDTRKLDSLNARATAERLVQKLAQDTEGYIKDNFSPVSPSEPGQPPAVDTGNLKNLLLAEPENPLRWVVNSGAEYSLDLEYGTHKMAERPFLLPAFHWIITHLPDNIAAKVLE